MKFLTREEIQRADDVRTEIVDVPDWGGQVEIKTLTVTAQSETIRMSASLDAKTNKTTIDNAMLQVATVLKGISNPVLELKDIVWLQKKSAGPISMLFNRIYKLSGLLTEEEVKAVSKEGDQDPS